MTKFCICTCIYSSSIFIPQYNLHVKYINREAFLDRYGKVLVDKGCNYLEEVIEEIEKEIARRKEHYAIAFERKLYIAREYTPLHPELYALQESFLHPEFLQLVNFCKQSSVTKEEVLKEVQILVRNIYRIPIFSEEFCMKLEKEIDHFEKSDMPKGRPNSMTRYGVILGELGFDEKFLDPLRENYLQPICSKVFPEWTQNGLDSHYAFLVCYEPGKDEEMVMHYDNAEVTLNVNITPTFEGCQLCFGAMSGEVSDIRRGFEHQYCWGILHRSRHMHSALPIENGKRYNMVIWLRSSSVRNKMCPMCNDEPQLEVVERGTGHGFTTT